MARNTHATSNSAISSKSDNRLHPDSCSENSHNSSSNCSSSSTHVALANNISSSAIGDCSQDHEPSVGHIFNSTSLSIYSDVPKNGTINGFGPPPITYSFVCPSFTSSVSEPTLDPVFSTCRPNNFSSVAETFIVNGGRASTEHSRFDRQPDFSAFHMSSFPVECHGMPSGYCDPKTLASFPSSFSDAHTVKFSVAANPLPFQLDTKDTSVSTDLFLQRRCDFSTSDSYRAPELPFGLGSAARPLLSASEFSGGHEALQVITSRLMRSHVDDLTLKHTPRGTGLGYGVGDDLDFTNSLMLSAGIRSNSAG